MPLPDGLRYDKRQTPHAVAAMPSIDEALFVAKKLKPAERLRLVERIWQSLAPEDIPSPTDRELAEVYRRSTEQGAGLLDTVPWPIVERMIADCVRDTRPLIYSAPRRFDLSMIFVVTSVYAVLLAGMSALQFPPAASLAVAGFITFVGIGQAMLFGGRRPRTASLVVGAVLYAVPMLIIWLMSGPRIYPGALILLSGTSAIIGGAILGYLAGVMVGGVFLLADIVRRRFRRRSLHNRESVPEDE
jgi:putative addiction module component (TIGR02574 family)